MLCVCDQYTNELPNSAGSVSGPIHATEYTCMHAWFEIHKSVGLLYTEAM